MKTISVNLGKGSYSINIDYNLIKHIHKHIQKLNIGNFGIIITSPDIYSLYKKLIKTSFPNKYYKIITVANGESAKSKKWFFNVIDEIFKLDGLNKKIFILCLGGGTIGDLGGFVASIYKRGIPYIQIPTTLLSQIDSSIGGKTGIDLKDAKNILGSFHQPKAVFIDPSFLATLPIKEIKQGLAEAIKYGVIKDKNFFNFLKQNHENIMKLEPSSISKIIFICAKIKAKIVEKDEKEEKGLRTILNFGHTFGHALESSLQYKKISHGDAISIGMLYAAHLSLLLKKCDKKGAQELLEIIKNFKLPTGIEFDKTSVYKSITYDKKFISGKIRMVLLRKIGEVEVIEDISPQKIKKTMNLTLTNKKKYGIL